MATQLEIEAEFEIGQEVWVKLQQSNHFHRTVIIGIGQGYNWSKAGWKPDVLYVLKDKITGSTLQRTQKRLKSGIERYNHMIERR